MSPDMATSRGTNKVEVSFQNSAKGETVVVEFAVTVEKKTAITFIGAPLNMRAHGGNPNGDAGPFSSEAAHRCPARAARLLLSPLQPFNQRKCPVSRAMNSPGAGRRPEGNGAPPRRQNTSVSPMPQSAVPCRPRDAAGFPRCASACFPCMRTQRRRCPAGICSFVPMAAAMASHRIGACGAAPTLTFMSGGAVPDLRRSAYAVSGSSGSPPAALCCELRSEIWRSSQGLFPVPKRQSHGIDQAPVALSCLPVSDTYLHLALCWCETPRHASQEFPAGGPPGGTRIPRRGPSRGGRGAAGAWGPPPAPKQHPPRPLPPMGGAAGTAQQQ